VPRFLLKPRWIAFTLLVVLLIVVMVNLGLWQLRRLDERKARNAEIRARAAAPVQPIDTLVPAGTSLDAAASARWYQATATGAFDDTRTVRIRNRSQEGTAGEHIVTPLVQADGTALLVNRGFLPNNRGELAIPPAPSGPVTVEGRVRTTQRKGAIGPTDPAEGTLDTLSRVDIERIGRQVPYPLEPVYVELTSPPPAGGLPALIPPPTLDEGPHLSYAGQWFLFSLCAVAGWVLVVRKSMKTERQQAARVAKAHAALGEPVPD
jgi:surfeit locus 1 family protein